MSTFDIFTYGTLMHPPVMRAVSGLTRTGRAALLPDYRRAGLTDEVFPAITFSRGDAVSGVLYRHLSRAAIARLDRFEDDYYQRKTVRLLLPDGAHSVAQAYVIQPRYRRRLTDEDWDFSAFLAQDRRGFSFRNRC